MMRQSDALQRQSPTGLGPPTSVGSEYAFLAPSSSDSEANDSDAFAPPFRCASPEPLLVVGSSEDEAPLAGDERVAVKRERVEEPEADASVDTPPVLRPTRMRVS